MQHQRNVAAPPAASRATKGMLIAVLALAVVAALVIPGLLLRSMTKMPQSTSISELKATALGSPVEVVIMVNSVAAGDRATGQLLQANADRTYRRMPNVIRIIRSESTRIMMGTLSDIRPGAIIAVRGSRTKEASTVDASRIVILTGYARIQP